MRDRVRQKLQDDRVADRRCHRDCLVLARGGSSFHDRNAIGSENLFGFKLVEQRSSRDSCLLDRFGDLLAHIECRFGSLDHRRSFVEPAQVVGIAPHVGKSARSSIGIRKCGDAGGIQNCGSFRDALAAHPACQQRLSRSVCVFRHFGSSGGRVGESLRRDDGQQAIAGGIFGNNVDCLHEAPGVGIGQDVDRIVVTPMGGKKSVESLQSVLREHGQLSAGGHERIGSQDSRSARIRDDAKPRAARTRLLAQRFGHVKEVSDVLHAQHTATAEGGFENVVASGQRAGVGRGSAGSGLGTSSLNYDDRLAESNLASCGKEGSRVTHRFHVYENALGVGIVAEIIDEIAPADIEHRSGRHDRAEAHVLLLAPVENGGLQCAALAEERNAAFLRHGFRECGIETDRGIHEAHAVGPDQAQGSALQMLLDFLFESGAIGALLAKSGGDHHRRFHSGIDALANDLRHGLCRSYNQRQIDSAGNVRNPLPGFDSQRLPDGWD